MKKLRYTLEEANKFFPVIMTKYEIKKNIEHLESVLNGKREKKKVFKYLLKNGKKKLTLIIPFDFRRSLNYKGLSSTIFSNGVNYKQPLARRSKVFVYVCFSEHCNRKFLAIGKGRDLRRKCKTCRNEDSFK
jgi:hypothetical protein